MKMQKPCVCGTIDMVTVRLLWHTSYRGPSAPHLLRGAVAERFIENPLFHQHAISDEHKGDSLIYHYPMVHYRWFAGAAIIVGFGDGARDLLALPWPSQKFRIGEQTLEVVEAICTLKQHVIQPTLRLTRYRMRAPWLPLNQEVYARYRTMNAAEQALERDRLAVAGVLLALRGLGVEFPHQLYAAFQLHRVQPCRHKGQEFLGFTGDLLANVDLPDGFAIGRAVSHGFGWMGREVLAHPEENSAIVEFIPDKERV